MKRICKSDMEKLGVTDRVMTEIYVQKHLRHPNICRLLEVIDTPDYIYLALEYSNHGELFTYINDKGALDENEARFFFRQLLAAVDYCHKHGVVHRDIKPENLMISNNKQLKLIDFGLAAFWSEEQMLDAQCGTIGK